MLPKTGELENKGLQGKIEYFVSVGMAKELAMVENNDYVGFVIMTNGNETTDFAFTKNESERAVRIC